MVNSNYLKLSLISGSVGFLCFNHYYFYIKNNLYPLDYFILGPISFLFVAVIITAIMLLITDTIKYIKSITIKDVVNTLQIIGCSIILLIPMLLFVYICRRYDVKF